jgi:hypothetical protein
LAGEVVFWQASVAVTEKVRVVLQPLVLSAEWVAVIVGMPPQLSVADEAIATLVSVGNAAGSGLHPKSIPVGTVSIGAMLSSTVTVFGQGGLVQSLVSVNVRLRVKGEWQPLSAVTLTV